MPPECEVTAAAAAVPFDAGNPVAQPSRVLLKHVWFVSSATFSNASAAVYFLSALYCSAVSSYILGTRAACTLVMLASCITIWLVARKINSACRSSRIKTLNILCDDDDAVWASGAAQAAQFVRIILRFAVSYWGLRQLDSA